MVFAHSATLIRILCITPMYPVGGRDTEGLFVREQAEALAVEGADVRVVHLSNRLVWPFSCLKASGKPSEPPPSDGMPVYRHEVRSLPAVMGLNRYVHSLSRGLAARLKLEWPDFRPDLIHAHAIIPGGGVGVSLAARLKCPLVVTSHGADTRLWLREQAGRRAILDMGRRGVPVVCVSEPIRQDLAGAGYPDPLLHVVSNGMDLAKVHAGSNPLAIQYADRPVILGVGNLKRTKGLDVFIEALVQIRETHPDVRGVIVGDGPERGRLERRAKRRGVADVLEMVGAKSPTETMRYMDACTIFCLPSWSEGFGMVYLEAMAHGKPVIAVERQGIAPVVTDPRAGLLVPPRDAAATAAAIRQLLDHPEESLAMGRRGRQAVMHGFTWSHNARRMVELFRNVVDTCREGMDAPVRAIAHVNFTVDRSVDLKLERMAAAARALGLPMDVLVYSTGGTPRQRDNFQIRRLPGRGLGRALAAKIQWPFRLMWAARELGPAQYAAVILRYPKLPFGWQYFLRRVDVPVITEHHTDEVAEIRGQGGWMRGAAAAVETRLRGGFLKQVSGVIGVTPEITDRLRLQAPQALCTVITNGVDAAGVPATGFTPFDGTVLRMVAVASGFVPWQGMDRLLNGMRAYSGSLPLKLVLIGTVPAGVEKLIDCVNRQPGLTIDCPGPLYGEAMDSYLGVANLAIASLALFRKQMAQACPLKVREYMARGIPFIYGYDDPDLPDGCEFAMKVPAEDTPIDMEAVIQFAVRTADLPDLAQRMRQHARERMDWKEKVRAMYSFVRDATQSENMAVSGHEPAGVH